MLSSKHLQREWITVEKMIEIYCESNHISELGICEKCVNLENYVFRKLDDCRWGEEKPTCSNCTIHCYRKSMAREIKEVMRFSGPKMIYKHPILAIKHIFDGRRKKLTT